ncbi:MAG TPA: hypothetical protein VM865_03165, partial [Acidobacteriaceae bacterium]|nr:hypothetical protein [Acidobacteriaceae bacterium]
MKSPHRRAERSLLLAAVALLTAAPHAGAFGYDPVGRRFDPVRPHQTTPPPSQQPPPPPSQPSADQPPDGPPPPRGKVLFQSHGDPPPPSEPPAPEPEGLDAQPQASKPDAQPQLTDADRAAIRITAFDLDLRLHPATSGVNARARLTLTNTAGKPLPRIALQISSTLRWGSASLVGAGHPSSPLPVVQHKLDTDADHTGQTSELILTLPSPLAPGASLALQLFYAGTVAPSAGRLQRLGASSSQALATDWDAVSPEASSLRGLGNILWFPAAIPQLFLSDGTLVPAVAKARLDHASTPIHLHLSVEYTGEPPVAAYFCGRRQPLQPLTDDAESPIAYGSGIATADFPSEPIGIRPLSLFVVAQPEALIAPLPAPLSKPSVGPNARSTPAVAPGNGPDAATAMLAVESTDDRALPPFAASAQRIAPLLQDWLGSRPLSALTVLDHTGQPFEDGPLLVAPVASLA